MRRNTWQLAVLLGFSWSTGLELTAADDPAEVVKKQKEKAAAYCKRVLPDGTFLHVETPNILLYGSKSLPEEKLKAWGDLLEEQLGLLRKAFALDDKKTLWPGKLAVFFFDEKRTFASFIRQIEQRRPESEELSSFLQEDDLAHIAACTTPGKQDPSIEAQVCEQLVTAVFNKVVGENSGVPGWVLPGLIQATVWRTAPNDLARKQRDLDRKKLAFLVTTRRPPRSAKELWNGGLEGEELALLRGSIVEFLAYGPDAQKFPDFLKAFRPEEGKTKSIDDGLAAVRSFQDKFDRGWANWVRAGSK